jgi:hypothetical protein
MLPFQAMLAAYLERFAFELITIPKKPLDEIREERRKKTIKLWRG